MVFELIGITSLGLVISSISRFVHDISADKIVKSHQQNSYKSTLSRTVNNETDMLDRQGQGRPAPPRPMPTAADGLVAGINTGMMLVTPWRWRQKQKKLLLLREERDRFNAMREIQEETRRFKQYYALAMAVLAFGLLWFMGALVFAISEKRLQDLSYFEALYFGFVALLTIG